MDNAVSLVQAYLRLNGYFTVSEYPVLQSERHGGYRAATDLDILAFRFAGAGRVVLAPSGRGVADEHFEPDPVLGVGANVADMIVGEVKEGKADLNQAMTDPAVLQAALARFGCCRHSEAARLVEELLHSGSVELPVGHRLRMVRFGSSSGDDGHRSKCAWISLGHITRFLQDYIREHFDVLRQSEHKDPALGFLILMEKALHDGRER